MLYANSLEYYGLSAKESFEIATRIVEFCCEFSDEEDYQNSYQPGIEWISKETLKKMSQCLSPEGRIVYEDDELTYVIILKALRFSLFWHDEECSDELRDALVEDLSKVQH